MKIYLAGAMTGLPNFGFDRFHEAAARLRDMAFEVWSPAEQHDGDTSQPWLNYILFDLPNLAKCDALVLLPDSLHSSGVQIEMIVAKKLGLRVIPYESILETSV